MLTARIFDTHRMSSDDGPGLRTTLFLKGCPLNCVWCHNPESISPAKEIWWFKKKCIACFKCIEICPQNALSATENGINVNRHSCNGCGKCAEICPAKAIELLGEEWTVNKAVEYALKDKSFYETSSGGVTLSGGEPTLQSEFAAEFFKNLKNKGIHTALDTCGLTRKDVLDTLYPVTDLFLWDIKTLSPEKHKKFTEVSNELILENLLYIADRIRQDKKHALWIRTPLIPQKTALISEVQAIAEFISEKIIDVIERWEMCAFNGSCIQKYKRLNIQWQQANSSSLNENQINSFRKILKKYPKLKEKTFFTGVITK